MKDIVTFINYKTPTEKLQDFIDSCPLDDDYTWGIIEGLKNEEEHYFECYRKNSGNFYEILGSIISRK